MKLKPNIVSCEPESIFNPTASDSFAANPLAVDILTGAKAGLDATTIKADILLRYEVPPIG